MNGTSAGLDGSLSPNLLSLLGDNRRKVVNSCLSVVAQNAPMLRSGLFCNRIYEGSGDYVRSSQVVLAVSNRWCFFVLVFFVFCMKFFAVLARGFCFVCTTLALDVGTFFCSLLLPGNLPAANI